MTLETLDQLGVPVEHNFYKAAVCAWWFVPLKHEFIYAKVVKHLWTYTVSPPSLSLIIAYFQTVLPPRDFPLFENHIQSMMDSLAPPVMGRKKCIHSASNSKSRPSSWNLRSS